MLELINEKTEKYRNGKKEFSCDILYGGDLVGRITGSSKSEYHGGYVYLDEMEYGYTLPNCKFCGGYASISAAKLAFEKQWEQRGRPVRPRRENKRKVDVQLLAGEENRDFYPTPSKVAGIMFSGIDFRYIGTVLEPSAGKGDLADCVKNVRRLSKNADIDCIELDENLRHILSDKGYKVVFDDFLRFGTGKKYDLILMNPLFSEGCKHLLKALQMQERGGQVCCLLNAETLRNPYTNERKVLAGLLQRYRAEVKFLKNSFSKAERKTDVEIAIVWVNIPVNYGKSNILEGLKKAQETARRDDEDITDVVSGDSIKGMIERYDTEVKLCKEFIREYEAMRPYILKDIENSWYNGPIIELSICGSTANGENDCMRALRGKYWHGLMSNKELTALFTETLRSKYRDIEQDMQDYDFNEFNIRKVILRMNAEIVGGLQEEIYKIFDKLSQSYSWYPECEKNIHYFNGWRTNEAHKVGMKAIIPANGCFASYSWSDNKFNVDTAYNAIADIEKVFNYLDGNMTAEVDTLRRIESAGANGITQNIVCKYFSVTFYKKGTIHIKMHPQTERIIDALNIYVCKGKNWLPPHYGKVSYEDMSDEERAVIDDFQGREKYEKVMEDPAAYLYDEQRMGGLLMIGTGSANG